MVVGDSAALSFSLGLYLPLLENDSTMPTLSIVEVASFTSTYLNKMVVRLPFSIHHDSGKLEDNESFPLEG